MRAFLTILVMFTSISVMAVDPVPCEEEEDLGTKLVDKVKQSQCSADAKKALRGICMAVGGKDLDSSPQGRYKFAYQKKILQASCVDIGKDSEQEIAAKVAKTWAANEQHLKCSNMQFDVQDGSIIKYAVNINNDEFIFDLARWKVNFNKVDPADQKTVLDYVKNQIDKNAGKPIEATLKRYYSILKEAGAKHKSEL